MAKKLTFHEWYEKLARLADEKKCPWLVPPEKDYPHDGYDDDLEPEDELGDMISYCD